MNHWYRAVLLSLCGILGSVATAAIPAQANGAFDGTYLRTNASGLEYLSLTQADTVATGYLYSIIADATSPNGIKETRVNLYGTINGQRAMFRTSNGASVDWSVNARNNGIDIGFQGPGGYLQHTFFNRASEETINTAITDFRTATARAQVRINAQRELADATTRLERDMAQVPRLLRSIVDAKSAADRADLAVAAASATLAQKSAAFAAAEKRLAAANPNPTSADDVQTVGELRVEDNARRVDETQARAALGYATSAQSAAANQLDRLRAFNTQLEQRIEQLRRIISHDKAIVR